MKNKVLPPRTQGVSKNSIAKHYGVNGGSVAAWGKGGCPQLPNGKFVLAKVEAWIRERDAKKQERASLKDRKTQAEIDRIQRDITKRDLEIAKEEGKVHGSAECSASLTEIRARESRVLHGLDQRFAAAFPEATKQAEWLEREIDDVLGRLAGEQ